MRRSYMIQPSSSSSSSSSSDLKQIREEKRSINNLREEKIMAKTSSTSSNKAEDYSTPEINNKKKLERKSTEDVNADADAFIKNFRQQLMIQRLQSIENYEKMLARGL